MKKRLNLVFILSLCLSMLNFSVMALEAIDYSAIPDEAMQQIYKIVDQKSNFSGSDGLKRKSRDERIDDNIRWYNKYHSVNKYYNMYGLDIKNLRNQDDFLDYSDLDRYAIHHGGIDPKKYRKYGNKEVFYKRMNRINPKAIPTLHFIYEGNKITYQTKRKFKNTVSAIKSLKNQKYVCKPAKGECGSGVLVITKIDNGIVLDGKKISTEEFVNKCGKRRYILQEYIVQHPTLAKFNPASVNTIRVVTTRWNDSVNILGAILRMGAKPNVSVDNAAQGGTFAPINLTLGRLGRYGYYYEGKPQKYHPISHVKYEGTRIPYWNETVKLLKELHQEFYELSSIGWDIAITERGPVIMEINPGWSLKFMQIAGGGIKERWNELKLK